MEYLNKLDGAVFFVDLLGIGALTKSQINLEKADYKPWVEKYNLEYNHQHLAAALLGTFRKILKELQTDYPNSKFAQLSDCAFIWSENITEIIEIANELMCKSVEHGILCRGGIACGEIIETTQDNDLGKFIIGKAVTNAVKLEGLAKGARVLIDEDVPPRVRNYNIDFSNHFYTMFQPFVNPLDYNTYDEFKWYLYPHMSREKIDLHILDYENRLRLTKERLKLASIVRHSPMLNWNSKSIEGLIQVKATISFMSESDLLDVSHEFDWTVTAGSRSIETVVKLEKLIDTDDGYYDKRLGY